MSSTDDNSAAQDAFIEKLDSSQRLAWFKHLSTYDQRRALRHVWSGWATELPPGLGDEHDAFLRRRSMRRRRRIETAARKEGLRFCQIAPALAEFGPRVRVYLKISGEPQDTCSTEYGHSSEERFQNLHYRVSLCVMFDEHTVVRFEHLDEWRASYYDGDKVEFSHQSAKEIERSVVVPKGVPLPAYVWRRATRTYLRLTTQYYAISERDRNTWLSGSSSGPASDSSDGSARKRPHASSSDGPAPKRPCAERP